MVSQIWLHHRCLGHLLLSIPEPLFPHLFTKELIEYFHCDVFQLAKHSTVSFFPSKDKGIEPFDLIHSSVEWRSNSNSNIWC